MTEIKSPQTNFFQESGRLDLSAGTKDENRPLGKTFLSKGVQIFQAPYRKGKMDRSVVDSVSQLGGVWVIYDKNSDRVDRDGVWRHVSGEEILRVRGEELRTRKISGWVRLDFEEKTDTDGNPLVREGNIIIVRKYRTVA